MYFREIYNIVKSENKDKICFVKMGPFFLTIGADAICSIYWIKKVKLK